MNTLHALYATCDVVRDGRPTGDTRTFRIGLPASSAVIYKRHARFDNAHYRNRRPLTVVSNGTSYPVRASGLEVRAVNAQGRGLGSERHWTARKVPVGALVIVPDASHTVETMTNRAWRATPPHAAFLRSQRGGVTEYGETPDAARLAVRRKARQLSLI